MTSDALLPDPALAAKPERVLETQRQRTERLRKALFRQIDRVLDANDLEVVGGSIEQHNRRDTEVLALANLILDIAHPIPPFIPEEHHGNRSG